MAGTIRLETKRLILRPHRLEDAAVLFRDFGSDEAMYAFSGWNPYASPELAEETVHRFLESYSDPRFYGWAIEREGDLIGTVGAYDYDADRNSIEIGLSIRRACWGQGYAQEALGCILHYLTGQEGIGTVKAWCAAENIASKKVMEQAGMQQTARLPGSLSVNGHTFDQLHYVYEAIFIH